MRLWIIIACGIWLKGKDNDILDLKEYQLNPDKRIFAAPRSSSSTVQIMKQPTPTPTPTSLLASLPQSPPKPSLVTAPAPVPSSTPSILAIPHLPAELLEDVGVNLEELERDAENNVREAVARMMDTLKETITEDKEELTLSRKLLITKDNAQFSVAATSFSPPSFFNIHLIGEISSRVLFSTISWLRQLPFFSGLKHSNQRKVRIFPPLSQCLFCKHFPPTLKHKNLLFQLLRQSWSDLFVLGLAQVHQEIHLTTILTAIADNIQAITALDEATLSRVKLVTDTVAKIKEYLTALTKLDMDSQEFGLLKIIAIFGSEPASVNTDYYESVCDKALGELREQTNQQEARYSKLLLRLSPLRSLQQDVLEEIFFGGLIGNVQIDTVIPTLLNMEQGELSQLLEA